MCVSCLSLTSCFQFTNHLLSMLSPIISSTCSCLPTVSRSTFLLSISWIVTQLLVSCLLWSLVSCSALASLLWIFVFQNGLLNKPRQSLYPSLHLGTARYLALLLKSLLNFEKNIFFDQYDQPKSKILIKINF